MIKTHYSMFKPAGEGVSDGLVTVKIVEEQRHNLTIIVIASDGLTFSKAETFHSAGYLFDLFMFFASLELVTLRSIKSVGLTEI